MLGSVVARRDTQMDEDVSDRPYRRTLLLFLHYLVFFLLLIIIIPGQWGAFDVIGGSDQAHSGER